MKKALTSQFTFPRLALKQKMFRLGWAKIRAVISESDMGGSKWLNAVSKCQCKIGMKKLGSKYGMNKTVFIFMLMETTSDSFLPKLTTKWTVNKVLRKGE